MLDCPRPKTGRRWNTRHTQRPFGDFWRIDYHKHCYYLRRVQHNVAFLATDVGRLFRKRFDVAARQFGVTGPQWRMLASIRRYPGSSQGLLASWLEVEAITAGRMIDRLEKTGLVQRRHDPADRRTWRLFLTDEAERLMDQLSACAKDVFDEALDGFSAEDRDHLQSLLERLRTNLSDEPVAEVKLTHG